MAIVVPGKTLCGLCWEPLRRDDLIKGFTAFLPKGHRLSRFSDAAFHAVCFAVAPERPAVEEVYGRFRAIWERRPVIGRDVATLAEAEAWVAEAFKDFC